jgi:hypothetical protein
MTTEGRWITTEGRWITLTENGVLTAVNEGAEVVAEVREKHHVDLKINSNIWHENKTLFLSV